MANNYTKKDLDNKNNEELISALYWVAVHVTNEVNSKRGLTKGTQKDEALVLQTVAKRFDMDLELLKGLIIKQPGEIFPVLSKKDIDFNSMG